MNALNSTVLSTFGREVTYSPVSGDPVTIRAIVDTAREAEEAVPGIYAVLFLRLGDLPKPPERGDQVSIDTTLYKVPMLPAARLART